MRTVIAACFVVVMLAGSALAQKQKPWTEWTKKDVDKTLNDSAWGQTQTEGSSGMPASSGGAITSVAAQNAAGRELNNRGSQESGETKPSTQVKFYVRFLSAKPVRAAFARQVLLSKTEADQELTGQLQAFVDRDFGEYIVISVGVEVANPMMAGPVTKAFSGASTEALQKNVFLERKDGKKLYLMEYRAPVGDGMGAKFIFQRVVDGQPFLSGDDNVKFSAQFSEKMKLNTRYKLSEMLYDGKLEY